jgi:polysaccharide deacetylase family protein (PEP-CTERM system associated)
VKKKQILQPVIDILDYTPSGENDLSGTPFSAPSLPGTFLITIDVEDWFQVENFKSVIPYSTWNDRELRVVQNTHRLLDLFDAINIPPAPPKATFFVLGWIARRLPHLVKEIHNRGHEVASHGFHHHLCTQQQPDALRQDLADSKTRLEDITGAPVFGYRAPSFSINNDILKMIEDSGYRYDSSYNSFALHGRYGKIDLSGSQRSGLAYAISERFFELPVSNLTIFGKTLPWGGGGYFRLFPFQLFIQGAKAIIKKESAYLFYMHPWEIDPGQPRVDKIPRAYKFRHYTNLHKTYTQLSRLIKRFKHCRFISLHQYLSQFKH